MTGFVPDIVDVLEKYELLYNLLKFASTNFFPKKTKWKKIMNEHIYGKHNRIWQKKIEKHEQLYFYSKVQTKSEIAEWWVWQKSI